MEYINAICSGSLAFSLGHVRIVRYTDPGNAGPTPGATQETFVAGGPVGLVEVTPVREEKPPAHELFRDAIGST
jgi:hypothetical protein